MEEGGAFGFLFRPSGVAYVVSSDGMLHVLGLPSGKDMQSPAPFVPANARWSAPVARGHDDLHRDVGKLRRCAERRVGDRSRQRREAGRVVEDQRRRDRRRGGVHAGGTLIAAIGAGKATGDGKANAIVALDAKTLQLKDWFTQPDADFVTGPTILRHDDKEIVAAATKDGRVVLLDAASLGGAESLDAAPGI